MVGITLAVILGWLGRVSCGYPGVVGPGIPQPDLGRGWGSLKTKCRTNKHNKGAIPICPTAKNSIEVALPLDAINKASIREKSIRHGHPSTLHLWWARRPLASCRAVLFASPADDPSSRPEEFPTEEAQDIERLRLFKLIENLVLWENSNNEQVLAAARTEINKSTGGNPPPVLAKSILFHPLRKANMRYVSRTR